MSVYMYMFTADEEHSTIQTMLCNVRVPGYLVYDQYRFLNIIQLRQWSSTFGYTVCFAVILAKTWRIYLIFTNPHQKKKVCQYRSEY